MHGLGCCPLHWTLPEPGRCTGSLVGGGVPATLSAGAGFIPLLIDGVGITWPGFTAWLQRPPGAGQFRIWLGSPYQGLVPSGTYGLLSRHSRGVAARLPGTSTHGMLRAPRTLLPEASCGTLQYVPDGSGARLLSAGDRHCGAGRKPVMHGGG